MQKVPLACGSVVLFFFYWLFLRPTGAKITNKGF
jgi:hypothetical protein